MPDDADDDASSGIEYEHLSVASSLWEDDYSIASNHGSANSISTASTASQFPTDIWSIETRKRIFGHRTYHAHAVPNTTISNLVLSIHTLATRILTSTPPTHPTPHILIIWSTAANALAAKYPLKHLFGPLLTGTYTRKVAPNTPFRAGRQPVLSCSPAALLRVEEPPRERERAKKPKKKPMPPTTPMFGEGPVVMIFAEMPDVMAPELVGSGGWKEVAELWSVLAGYAGTAGEESQVHVLLEPGGGCSKVARGLREVMRREGVEVPGLVAAVAERGIVDPVVVADDEEEEEDGEDGGVGLAVPVARWLL